MPIRSNNVTNNVIDKFPVIIAVNEGKTIIPINVQRSDVSEKFFSFIFL